MPISLASNATAPRILSARRPSVISASGSPAPVKVVLQDELSRDAVASGFAVTSSHARFAQRSRCGLRREAFVAKLHSGPEAALERSREAAGALGHRVRHSVGMDWQSDYEQRGPPFFDERCNRTHRLLIARCGNRDQRVGQPRMRFADRDADAL